MFLLWFTLLLLHLSNAEIRSTTYRRPGYLELSMSPTTQPTQSSQSPSQSPSTQPTQTSQSPSRSPSTQPTQSSKSPTQSPISPTMLPSSNMLPSSSPVSLSPVTSPSSSSYLHQKDILIQQTYTCRTLKYRVVTSEAFKTAINAATATLLGFTESTIVTTFNAADCRVPVAGTYHCYVVVLTSNADYASAKKALALPSAFEYTGSVLSKTTGLPIVVSGYQFEQPTNGPTTIPLPAVSIGASSSSRNGINQTNLIIAIVISIAVCLLIVICVVVRVYLYPSNPNLYSPKTPEKRLVSDDGNQPQSAPV